MVLKKCNGNSTLVPLYFLYLYYHVVEVIKVLSGKAQKQVSEYILQQKTIYKFWVPDTMNLCYCYVASFLHTKYSWCLMMDDWCTQTIVPCTIYEQSEVGLPTNNISNYLISMTLAGVLVLVQSAHTCWIFICALNMNEWRIWHLVIIGGRHHSCRSYLGS